MPELHLAHTSDTLTLAFGEHRASVPWETVDLPRAHMRYEATQYGRTLFNAAFADADLRASLAGLERGARLLIVTEGRDVAALGWEYLRDESGRLLSARLDLLRGLPEDRRRDAFEPSGPLEIVAVPASPIDEEVILDTGREWKNLIKAVETSGKALTLTRVRPPTLSQMERALPASGTSIICFMGHGREGVLAFEDDHGRSRAVTAAAFVDSLDDHVFLVVLNSCRSAMAGERTTLGNVARELVAEGVPYALGMQFDLPDNPARVLSETLFDHLLSGRSVENAVQRSRRALAEYVPDEAEKRAGTKPDWLAGIPVLYTGLREPAPPIVLDGGAPAVKPDPEALRRSYDLSALPEAQHFVGRAAETAEAVEALVAHREVDFVALHGLGGVGKTALARRVAERVGWHFGDKGLAVSFETFTRRQDGEAAIDAQFAPNFYARLARFYNIDMDLYPETTALQHAILQERKHTRSLLVLDNVETLIEAQKRGEAEAKALATFVSRLKEGDGGILLTTRVLPPGDWGECKVVPLRGLSEEEGADLFLAMLPADRKLHTLRPDRKKLSARVDGHPLAVRLLAARFAEEAGELADFLDDIEGALREAEQATPGSLEDPERQATLYACIDYSVGRLRGELQNALRGVSVFRAPFEVEAAAVVLDDADGAPALLQELVRLSLLDAAAVTVRDGTVVSLEMHPMVRWYVERCMGRPGAMYLERHAQAYASLAQVAAADPGDPRHYHRSARTRLLVRQGLPDLDAALAPGALSPAEQSRLAYRLAYLYTWQGQNRRALALYEQALRTEEELGKMREVALTQNAMADVLVQLGRPQEALTLYEQTLRTKEKLGDVREVAVTQHAMADVLRVLGRPQETLALYEQTLRTFEELGEVREVAVTQGAIAHVLVQLGRPQEALALYEQALRTFEELGDVREVATVQGYMGNLLVQIGRPQGALDLYEKALHTQRDIGHTSGVAVTQHAMANVLRQLGRPQEALALCEQALYAFEKLGDVREVAVTQNAMANVLVQLGQPQEALALYEQALRTKEELGDVREVSITQNAMANVLVQLGQPQEALALYEQALRTFEELGDVREVSITQSAIGALMVHLGRPEEAITLFESALDTAQKIGEVRGIATITGNLCQLLLHKGEQTRALNMVWQAYINLEQSGFAPDTQDARQLLTFIKSYLGSAQFDAVWAQTIDIPQPAWLQGVQATELGACGSVILPPAQIDMIVNNTVAVMTVIPGKREEWRVAVEAANAQAERLGAQEVVALNRVILALLNGEEAVLPEDNPYHDVWQQIQAGIEAGGPEPPPGGVSAEVMEAVQAFVNAEDWDAARRVVEARQAALLTDEVDRLFQQNIAAVQSQGNEQVAQHLTMQLGILRVCRAQGIEAAFAQLREAQAAAAQLGDLPFDLSLVGRLAAALQSEPEAKIAAANELASLAQTEDADLRAFVDAAQRALFGGDLAALGAPLEGVYRAVWQALVAAAQDAGDAP